MRLRTPYLAALTLLALACSSERPSAPLPPAERPLDLLAQPTMAGDALDPASLSGKVVVVNFWSPHCTYCAKEMPGLQAVADKLQGRGLELVTVMMEGTRPAAQAFIDASGLKAPALIGTPELAAGYGMLVYPWTVVIDRNGKAVHAIRGMRDAASFQKTFERYL